MGQGGGRSLHSQIGGIHINAWASKYYLVFDIFFYDKPKGMVYLLLICLQWFHDMFIMCLEQNCLQALTVFAVGMIRVMEIFDNVHLYELSICCTVIVLVLFILF